MLENVQAVELLELFGLLTSSASNLKIISCLAGSATIYVVLRVVARAIGHHSKRSTASSRWFFSFGHAVVASEKSIENTSNKPAIGILWGVWNLGVCFAF